MVVEARVDIGGGQGDTDDWASRRTGLNQRLRGSVSTLAMQSYLGMHSRLRLK